jgi:uncharacterized protein
MMLRMTRQSRTRVAALALLLLAFFAFANAAEVIPPPPRDHFNDYAGIVRPATRQQLENELVQFERDTSTQIVVATFPTLKSDSSPEDYTRRVAEKWGVGRKDVKNGLVLFVFQASHDIQIATGYGTEGAVPDALAKQIIENEIAPRFRSGDFDGGLTAGVHALMAAVRHEYRGTGRTLAEQKSAGSAAGLGGGGIIFLVIVILTLSRLFSRGQVYGRRGRRTLWLGGGPWISGGGGGGWSGSSGGGSFSGGGGTFGGGGAGGKW